MCAGLVVRIPYAHNDLVTPLSGLNFPIPPSPAASPSASATSGSAGLAYEFVLAVTRVHAARYGEDFPEFMYHGATQRSSLIAWVDAFTYLPRHLQDAHSPVRDPAPMKCSVAGPPCNHESMWLPSVLGCVFATLPLGSAVLVVLMQLCNFMIHYIMFSSCRGAPRPAAGQPSASARHTPPH